MSAAALRTAGANPSDDHERRRASAESGRDHPLRPALFCTLLCLALWTAAYMFLENGRARLEQSESQHLRQLAFSYAQHVARTLDLAAARAGYLVAGFKRRGATTLQVESGLLASADFPSAGIHSRTGGIIAYLGSQQIANAFRISSDMIPVTGTEQKERVHLGLPRRVDGTGEPVIFLSMRLPDGDPTGGDAMFVGINPDQLGGVYRPMLAERAFLSLSGTDRVLRFRTTREGMAFGTTFGGTALIQYDRSTDRGMNYSVSNVDGLERLIAYERVPGYNLHAAAGNVTKDFMAPHRERARVVYTSVALLCALLIAFTYTMAAAGTRAWQANARAEAARHEAEQANLLKTRFLAQISHELRTPLHGIIGYADMLEVEAQSEDQRSSANSILLSGRHLMGLVNQLLDVAKLEAGNESIWLEEVDIVQLAREIVSGHLPDAQRKSLKLVVDIPEKLTALADSLAVSRILHNLLNNAIKFTEQGEIRLVAELRGSRVRVHVSDTGIGVSPEDQERLFSMYAQAGEFEARRFAGAGLGLYLCKQLVELMNGQIGMESTAGVGSVFWFEVPAGRRYGDGETMR